METQRRYQGISSSQATDHHELTAQAQLFSDEPLLNYLLDAVPDVFLILNEHRQVTLPSE